MLSTVKYTKTNRINVTETALETAVALTGKRGAFNVQEVMNALKSQECTEITEKQVRNALTNLTKYSIGLKSRGHGWYAWK